MRLVSAAPVLLSALALAGCLGAREAPVHAVASEVAAPATASAAHVVAPPAPAAAVAPPSGPAPRVPAEGYAAHEWGTFTSVAGSDGALLGGLHHEDEPLPDFVIGRTMPALGLPMNRFKSVEALPEQVTQKMETPVIYFHAREALDVSVTVDFPDGVISQWYPSATGFAPEIGDLQALAGGSMTWDVSLAPGEEGDAALAIPWVHEDDIWAPSRRVEAAPLRTAAGEWERFIFYRGLARFEVPFVVREASEGGVILHNASEQLVPDVVLLRFDGERGAVVRVGGIEARGERRHAVPDVSLPLQDYLSEARAALQEALEASGLFADEARAMVDTWSASYFRTPGLRALVVLPREWTDALLPIRLDPAPAALVRTLVGRVELLTRAEEEALCAKLAALHAADALPTDAQVDEPLEVPWETLALLEEHLGRFAEPKLRRAWQVMPDGPVRAWVAAVLASVAVPTGG